jgi:Acetyltransferases
MEITFLPVKTEEQINHLAQIADEVWHEHFIQILTVNQIDYMVDKFQSVHAMTEQMQQGYQYFFLRLEDQNIGYTGIKIDEDKLFLSKLYILKKFRGQGYASKAFTFLEEFCKERGLHAIWLTVNRFNENTIQVYRKKGFETIRTQVADIGNGFVMDDYIMEKEVLQ